VVSVFARHLPGMTRSLSLSVMTKHLSVGLLSEWARSRLVLVGCPYEAACRTSTSFKLPAGRPAAGTGRWRDRLEAEVVSHQAKLVSCGCYGFFSSLPGSGLPEGQRCGLPLECRCLVFPLEVYSCIPHLHPCLRSSVNICVGRGLPVSRHSFYFAVEVI